MNIAAVTSNSNPKKGVKKYTPCKSVYTKSANLNGLNAINSYNRCIVKAAPFGITKEALEKAKKEIDNYNGKYEYFFEGKVGETFSDEEISFTINFFKNYTTSEQWYKKIGKKTYSKMSRHSS